MMRLVFVFTLLMLAAGPAQAGEMVPFPTIPKAIGNADVHAGVDIRRNHMKQLLHQRDETMYKGLSTDNERLQGCLTCHAVRGEDGHAVSYQDPKHFCRVCHDYVAVRVDCFECHASTPDTDLAAGGQQ